MKHTLICKKLWLVLAAAVVLTLVLALAVFAQTETPDIELISYQVSEDADGAFSLRLIAGVSSLDYSYCGYRVELTERNAIGNPVSTIVTGRDARVYSSIFGGETEYAVSEISEFPYASLATVTGLRSASSYTKITVCPFVVAPEGGLKYGETVRLVYAGEEDAEGYAAFAPVSAEALPPRHTVVLDAEMQAKWDNYLPTAWPAEIESLASQISDADTFAFAMQSDSHYTIDSDTNNTMNCLKALTHFLPLDFISNTGDLIKGYQDYEENKPEKSMESMRELVRRYTEDVNTSVLLGMGNHDTNQVWSKAHGVPSDQMDQSDFYDLVVSKLKPINGDYMVTDGESSYYYVDFPYDEIRVVVLNTTDSDYETRFGSLQSISAEQVAWFRDVALDTEYSVLVMSHIPLAPGFPEMGNNVVTNNDLIRGAVNTFVTGGGDFIAYICGHTHLQSDMVDSDGRLHVSFANNALKAEVVTIDKTNRKIVTYGIGTDIEDRSFDY